MDLSTLSNATSTVGALGNLILVTPQEVVGYQPQSKTTPDGQVGPKLPALLFHYEGEQSVTLESDITNHFVEDNTAVQDQIAKKPIIINTHGFIGELNDVVPKSLVPIKKIADKLTVISAYTPVLSESAINAYNQAAFLYSSAKTLADSAVSSWNALTGNKTGFTDSNGTFFPIQSKQQQYYKDLAGYWENRYLFTVQTPWAIYQDMAIKSLRAIQDAETKMITDFEISFQQIRKATTETLINPDNNQGRAFFQSSSLTNLGNQILKPSSTNPLSLVGVA